MVLSFFLFKEKFNKRKVISLVMTFIGCVFVTGFIGSDKPLSFGSIMVGLGAGLGYALYSIFSRFAIEKKYTSFTVTTYTFLFALIGCLPFIKPKHFVECMVGNTGRIPLYIILILFNTIIAYILYTNGLKGLENSVASIIASIEPVVATIVGVVLFKEKVNWMGILGMILVLASCAIIGIKGKKGPVSFKNK